MASRIISFTLNGREVEVMIKPLTTLQTVLREQFSYTAAKNGCRQGGCGSCTVLVNGEPMTSCLLPVEDIAGQGVTTLEGLTPAATPGVGSTTQIGGGLPNIWKPLGFFRHNENCCKGRLQGFLAFGSK